MNFQRAPFSFTAVMAIAVQAVSAQVQDRPITYSEHVAPILNKHCVSCHRPGEGAPFDLLSYRDAKRRSGMLAEVTATGQMPPWRPERGHTPLIGERGLTDAEKAIFAAWAAQGAPEGDPAKAPSTPEFPKDGWRLGTPDLVVEMEGTFEVAAEGPDLYQNFVIPLPPLPENSWIIAVEYRASAPQAVHHCLIGVDYSGLGREMDAEDPRVGFQALDQMFEDTRLATYAVGSLPYFLPDGVAHELKPGGDLILETHFFPTGKAERERTKVALYFTKEPPTKKLVHLSMPPSFGITTGLDIPAGEPRHTIEHRCTIAYDVYAFHIFPHAHMLCREMKSVARFPDGKEQVLIWIKDWDFAWQEQYRFPEGTLLPAGTVIEQTYVYDNSAGNPANPHHPPQRVKWGHQTTDEMASMSMTVIPVDNANAESLREAHFQYQKQQYLRVPVEALRPSIEAEVLRRFDKNRNGELGLIEVMRVLAFAAEVHRKSPDNHAFHLNEIAFARTMVPELMERAVPLVRAALLAGISLLLLAIAGSVYWWRRRRSKKKGNR